MRDFARRLKHIPLWVGLLNCFDYDFIANLEAQTLNPCLLGTHIPAVDWKLGGPHLLYMFRTQLLSKLTYTYPLELLTQYTSSSGVLFN